jgi:hypothetical protein
MSDLESLEKAKRETVRWHILRVLDSGRPGAVSEMLITECLKAASLGVTMTELRRELDYLADRQLVTLHRDDTPVWSAKLTALGVNVVEYTVECKPGIARPPRW